MAQFDIIYSQRRKVISLKEFTHRIHVSGSGSAAVFRTESRGWGVVLEPGYDVFFVGAEKPAFLPGQHITLSLKGVVQHADAPTTREDHDNKDAPSGGQRDR